MIPHKKREYMLRKTTVFLLLSSTFLLGNEVSWGTISPGKERDLAEKQKLSTQASGDWGGLAAFGEVGPKNFRGSATYGVYFNPLQRFKVSGEYLTQELSFHLNSHHKRKWVGQYAVGGQYQYLFNNRYINSLDLGTAYNQAFSYDLKSDGRIAGSYSSLSFIGTTISLWKCGFLALHLDYDWIKFVRKYNSDRLSNGFGGTASFTQQLPSNFSLNLTGEFRPAFNSCQALLNWNHQFSSVGIDIGLFGNLTTGHNHVRSIQTGGLRLGLSFGPKSKSCGRVFNTSSTNSKCYAREFCNIQQWISRPAVYMPVVLSIADAKASSNLSCPGPVRIANQPPSEFQANLAPGGAPETTTYDVTMYFTGPGSITYSVSYDPSALPPGDNVTIDPVSGILSLYNEGMSSQGPFFITVTAQNSCGAASFTAQISWQTP